MKPSKATPIVGFALALTLFSGCLWAPDLDRVRRDIQRQLPGVSFHRDIALSFGPAVIGLARLLVKLVPDAEEARPYLSDVSRVTVAVYEAKNVPREFSLKTPEELKRLRDA
ncbi:MAG: hypothetical protein P8181_15375, partial [bacterium]